MGTLLKRNTSVLFRAVDSRRRVTSGEAEDTLKVRHLGS